MVILVLWGLVLVGVLQFAAQLEPVFIDFRMEMSAVTKLTLGFFKLLKIWLGMIRYWLLLIVGEVVGLAVVGMQWRSSSRKWVRWPLWSMLFPLGLGIFQVIPLLLSLLTLLRQLG